MKRFFIIAVMLSAFLQAIAFKWEVSKENLSYDVMFKWGFINKKAGEVSLTTSPDSMEQKFDALLIGASASWADRFYMLRDTLIGTIDSKDFMPYYYEKIAHEGGSFNHDILRYTKNGNKVTADATVKRQRKKNTDIECSSMVHEAEGATLDMLSSFYYMRQINFDSMKKGDSVKLNIFSGRKKEYLTIHFQGLENVKINDNHYNSYHITFTFTTEGGKVSSDNMDAWISTHPTRIPLLMEGKLPVGKVRAIYSGEIPN